MNRDSSIKNLTISNYSCFNDPLNYICPIFPQLHYLTTVDFTGFDLSLWIHPFSSLYSASLKCCILPSKLFCFQFLSKLTLITNITSLDFSGIFQNLKPLNILHCRKLTSLILNSSIKNIQLKDNSSLQSIIGIGSVKSLKSNLIYV
jgi:hypothetical protein